jgi:hypothetical protein
MKEVTAAIILRVYSKSAMTSGLEWNIKLSQYDSGDILEKIRATFEGYWNNPEFTPFIAAIDSERLRQALKSERRSSQDEAANVTSNFDYRDFCKANPGKPNKLLFVAHRKEILR